MILSKDGQRILQLLVERLPNVDPDKPHKMLGYKEVHEILGLQNVRGDWGDSLKAQGLQNLAEWTKYHGKPAITGLIVNQQDYSPGRGYYTLFDRKNDDFYWWKAQIVDSKDYDWSADVGSRKPIEPNNSLRTQLLSVLQNYAAATNQEFAGHPLAAQLRQELPATLGSWISDQERYFAEGSPGQGVWAGVPWLAVLDGLITDTVQEGYYIVYLFDAQQKGIHLSLNQGVTSVRDQYGAGSSQALKARAQDLLSRLGPITTGLNVGPIDLSAPSGRLGSLYEIGSVCSVFYPADNIPSNEALRADFNRFMILYGELAARDERLFSSADTEDDELGMDVEDAKNLREHKRIERNRNLSKKAKKIHGYKCKACGFDFEEKYGPIGREFIEAHHLVPLARLKGEVVSLSPQRDFTVLCSNCHRMIHKTESVGNVEEFRTRYLADSFG